MTRNQIAKHIKEITAFGEGKDIERFNEDMNAWRPCNFPRFTLEQRYRVAPTKYFVHRSNLLESTDVLAEYADIDSIKGPVREEYVEVEIKE